MPKKPPPPAPKPQIIAAMCLTHERWPGSLRAVKSLKGQVDVLYLGLNKFTKVPGELKQDWIRIAHRSKTENTDAAYLRLLRKLEPEGAHVLLGDDDLEYPKSYVKDFLAAHKQHPNAILTHHGHVTEYPDAGDFTYAEGLDLREPQHGFKQLSVPGTGVSFIPGAVFEQLRFYDLPFLTRIDIHLACNSLKHNLEVIGIPHERGYFYMLGGPGPNHWIEMPPESEWMERVYKAYRSYDLSLARPPQVKSDLSEAKTDPPPAAKTPLATSGDRVVALMGMVYRRWPESLQAVESLEGQVDTLYLYLDGFPQNPPELKRDWIQILYQSKDEPDDTALWHLLRRREVKNAHAHVLLGDDNLRYPNTYVQYFLNIHKEYPDALLTHHGHIEDRSGTGGFTYAECLSFREPSRQIHYPNVPGSGVSFIPKSIVDRLELNNPPALKRVDIHLACNCVKLKIPVIGMQHRPTFIEMINTFDLSNWINLPSDISWMNRVYKTYQSYGLDAPRPSEVASDPPKPKGDPAAPRAAGDAKVVATMCLQRRRWPGSLQAVESMKGQIDTLYLCLNDFWEVPGELKQSWIKILHLGKNLGDAARFYLLRNLGPLEAHVVSCDDDIKYPPSYVRDFLAAMLEHPDALLTHHGRIAQYQNGQNFRYQSVMSFQNEAREVKRLTLPGSGVTFIPQSIFNRLKFTSLTHFNQADVHLACNCLKLGVPIVGLPHERHYFRNLGGAGSIYSSVTSRSDWMSKVYKIYQSYDLSLTQPPASGS